MALVEPIISNTSEPFAEERRLLFPQEVPSHVAIIMDGNRRWAKARGLPPEAGHFQGVSTLFECAKKAAALGIKTLTVFGMSTENWSRSEEEVTHLLEVIQQALVDYQQKMIDAGVCFHAIGDLSRFSPKIREQLRTTEETTSACQEINLVVALNYGGRDEICRAVKKIIYSSETGEIDKNSLSEKDVAQYLDTYPWGDPELIVRTSGEHRLSNFLLWQASYAEVITSTVLWPDFHPDHLVDVLIEYQNRQTRKGK